MSALTPICVKCRLEMRCVKNNRLVCDPPAACGPSTYWLGDEFECPECKVRIITGFGVPLRSENMGEASRAAALQFDYERPQKRTVPRPTVRPVPLAPFNEGSET